jgi:hypothetical protein
MDEKQVFTSGKNDGLADQTNSDAMPQAAGGE